MSTSDVWGARADQVGSLLRPDRLIAARDKANARDFAFLRSGTSQIPEITLPGPG